MDSGEHVVEIRYVRQYNTKVAFSILNGVEGIQVSQNIFTMQQPKSNDIYFWSKF